MSSSAEAITVPMAYLAVDHQGGGMHMNQAAWGLLIATREFHNKNNKNAVSLISFPLTKITTFSNMWCGMSACGFHRMSTSVIYPVWTLVGSPVLSSPGLFYKRSVPVS